MDQITNLEITYSEVEWDAWQEVVRLWPGDMNDPRWNPLVLAIRRWGERLSALRDVQTPETRVKALGNLGLL